MNKNTKITTGAITYTFTDEDDHVFAKFRINPMDVNMASRAIEVGEWFENHPDEGGDMVAINRLYEEKIAYVLGYKPEDLFGEITATTVFPNGQVFAVMIMDKILSEIQPQIEKRTKAFEAAQKKYLTKYSSEK